MTAFAYQAAQPSEWQIRGASAQHKSGLTVQLDKGRALDIQGLEKIIGTPWALQANVLVEQGIQLLEAR